MQTPSRKFSQHIRIKLVSRERTRVYLCCVIIGWILELPENEQVSQISNTCVNPGEWTVA